MRKRSALVLGTRVTSARIVRELQDLGYQAVASAQLKDFPLPDSGDLNAEEPLEKLFRAFQSHWGAGFIHPGSSHWAERVETFSLSARLGLEVVGPSKKAAMFFANKLLFLLEADRLKIENLVISDEPLQSLRETKKIISTFGFPIVFKSVREGEHGFGIKVFQNQKQLEQELSAWMNQLQKNVGEALFFAERYVEAARRMSVPFFRAKNGKTVFFTPVESSLQKNHKKYVELCPAPNLDSVLHHLMLEKTEAILDYAHYVGVGMMEFLVEDDRCYLIQGLPRLNTAYHLWEKIDHQSAVEWQMSVFDSKLAPKKTKIKKSDHGMSFRIYAEDSLLQIPQPGKIHEFSLNTHHKDSFQSYEIDLGYEAGETIPINSDGLLATAVVTARSNERCRQLARKILSETWIAGSLQTNQHFLKELLDHPWVRENMVHASFIDEDFLPRLFPEMMVAATMASLVAYMDQVQNCTSGDGLNWMVGDQWIEPQVKKLRFEGEPLFWKETSVGEWGMSGFVSGLGTDDKALRFCVFPITHSRWQVRLGEWVLQVKRFEKRARDARDLTVEWPVLAQLSGRVHALFFLEQTTVPPHEPLLMIESLQTLVPHALPVSVRLKQWKVRPEDVVYAGQALAIVEKI